MPCHLVKDNQMWYKSANSGCVVVSKYPVMNIGRKREKRRTIKKDETKKKREER